MTRVHNTLSSAASEKCFLFRGPAEGHTSPPRWWQRKRLDTAHAVVHPCPSEAGEDVASLRRCALDVFAFGVQTRFASELERVQVLVASSLGEACAWVCGVRLVPRVEHMLPECVNLWRGRAAEVMHGSVVTRQEYYLDCHARGMHERWEVGHMCLQEKLGTHAEWC